MINGRVVVLQVLSTLEVGGAESRIMDILRHLDRDRIQYDFLLHDEGPDAYEAEAVNLGAHVYRVPRFRMYNIAQYKSALKKFFLAHPEIDIVQGHMTSTASIYLPIAKKCGIKTTIAHVRSAGVDAGLKGTLTNILRKHLFEKADYAWACSSDAAIAVYGKENYESGRVNVIPNAIDVDSFALTSEGVDKALEIRKEYGILDAFVVGHIGRFHYAKNHEFLVEVFAEIAKLKDNARLLLVGEGSLMEATREKCVSLRIEDKVVFAGKQSGVQDYYHAMDVIVFPSRYEGLPGTIVESQASGVPALVSSAVTKDVGVTNLVEYKSLEKTAASWARSTVALYDKNRVSPVVANTILKEKGFDVKAQVNSLTNMYLKMGEE